jgi:hypothetical protein
LSDQRFDILNQAFRTDSERAKKAAFLNRRFQVDLHLWLLLSSWTSTCFDDVTAVQVCRKILTCVTSKKYYVITHIKVNWFVIKLVAVVSAVYQINTSDKGMSCAVEVDEKQRIVCGTVAIEHRELA